MFFHLQQHLQQTTLENIVKKGDIAHNVFDAILNYLEKVNLRFQPLPTNRPFVTSLQQTTLGNIVAKEEITRYIYFLQRTC